MEKPKGEIRFTKAILYGTIIALIFSLPYQELIEPQIASQIEYNKTIEMMIYLLTITFCFLLIDSLNYAGTVEWVFYGVVVGLIAGFVYKSFQFWWYDSIAKICTNHILTFAFLTTLNFIGIGIHKNSAKYQGLGIFGWVLMLFLFVISIIFGVAYYSSLRATVSCNPIFSLI